MPPREVKKLHTVLCYASITYYREASDRYGPLGPDQSYRWTGPDHHLVIMRSLAQLNILRNYLNSLPGTITPYHRIGPLKVYNFTGARVICTLV